MDIAEDLGKRGAGLCFVRRRAAFVVLERGVAAAHHTSHRHKHKSTAVAQVPSERTRCDRRHGRQQDSLATHAPSRRPTAMEATAGQGAAAWVRAGVRRSWWAPFQVAGDEERLRIRVFLGLFPLGRRPGRATRSRRGVGRGRTTTDAPRWTAGETRIKAYGRERAAQQQGDAAARGETKQHAPPGGRDICSFAWGAPGRDRQATLQQLAASRSPSARVTH